jgi:glutaredoxin
MKNKIYLFLIVIIILIAGFFLLVKPVFTGKSTEELKLDEFAQYLTSSNVTMYGTSWCSHCQNQKKLFGKSFKYVNYIDCDRESEVCALEGITGYPTWKINGTSYPGEKSLLDLAQLTNYTLSI